MITRRLAVIGGISAFGAPSVRAQAKPLRIGVLNDRSGFYADSGGAGGAAAVQMAVRDFGSSVLGRPIQVFSADHQNKADVALSIAGKWFDAEGVEVIVDLPNSATALAVQQLGLERRRITLVTGAGSAALLGKQCSPTSVQWTYDSYAISKVSVEPVLSAGGDSWFFITANYAGGIAIEDSVRDFVLAGGGRVLGAARHPVGTSDYSSFILQARASGAKVIAFASAGQDMQNAVRQAREFGLARGGSQTLVTTAAFLTDIHGLGLDIAQGLRVPATFYWDLNEAARAWSMRFFAEVKRMPTMLQAGNYSAVSHYLGAVREVGTTDAMPVMAAMRNRPVNDFMTDNGIIREDGHLMRDMYLFEVKAPEESKSEWDLYRLVGRLPASEAAIPLADSKCPYLKT